MIRLSVIIRLSAVASVGVALVVCLGIAPVAAKSRQGDRSGVEGHGVRNVERHGPKSGRARRAPPLKGVLTCTMTRRNPMRRCTLR